MTHLSDTEQNRYARHLILDEVGIEGQEKIKNASILCVGSGGLGAPLLMYLAAAGVGKIGIVDFDRVEISNLQRQIIHGDSNLGQEKVESAAARMADINPHISIQTYNVAFTSDNALEIAQGYDLIVDGTDNFPTRYLINDVSEILGIPNIYGSVYKFEGQASVFNYQGGPTYRDLYPDPPPPEMVPNCAEGGVLGVLPGLIGMIQATETLKVILGLGETLSGRLLLYDAKKMSFRELKLVRAENAKIISKLVDYQRLCGILPRDKEDFERLNVVEVNEKINASWSPFVIDVRTREEAALLSLSFTDLQQSHEEIETVFSQIPKDVDILVYCRSGVRSAMACSKLTESGFKNVVNLEGGIQAWMVLKKKDE